MALRYVVAACAWVLAGCVSASIEHRDAGDVLIAQQRYAEAAFEYTLGLQAARSAGLLVRRAQAWEGLGRIEDAILDYDAALELDPESIEALVGRGLVRVQDGLRRRSEEHDTTMSEQYSVLRILAMVDLDRAVTLSRWDPYVFRSRAYALHHFGDHAGALKDLDRVLRLGAGDLWTYDLRGKVRQALGDWAGSTEEFTIAIMISPWDPGVFARRGFGYLNSGKFGEAERDFSRSLALDSLDGRTWYLRALARVIRKDIAGACNDACRGSALGDGDAAALARAFACECR
jgi:tetratricopeptide (TPR) repeat protein